MWTESFKYSWKKIDAKTKQSRMEKCGLSSVLAAKIIMVTLCNRADHYIFAQWFLSFFFLLLSFFSSPNLSGRRLDVYHTSTHGVALVRI